MKKKLTRLFSVLLAAVLVFGTLPVSAMGTDVADPPASAVDDTSVDMSAAEPEKEEASAVDETPDGEVETQSAEAVATYASSADVQYKIVHLDCGRKYFTKDWIIALLYEMQNDGYNQLQLAFGNDGLRFLLNDMTFTANDTTYDNDTVVAKVKAGNKAQNSSGDESYLTEGEMDEIIAKAKELGIEIVPLLNLPGHANAILDIADDDYNASSSDNTLDVTNENAVAFGEAIFQKYVDYFADKGCKFFNFGADEYANDTKDGGAFSFSRLDDTHYQAFVSFINDLAGYISEKGMTPRAFNDGLYYNSQNMTNSGNLGELQVCYWSSGWEGYNVASASTISDNDYEMINTNGGFYYVLGKDDNFDSGYSYASGFDNTEFAGDDTISNPVGSMFCIWCDYPNAETETEVAKNTRLVLRAMAQRMENKTVSVSEEVVANGFNADGTINNASNDSTADQGEATENRTINLTIGQTKTDQIVSNTNYSGTYTTDKTDVAKVEKVEYTPATTETFKAVNEFEAGEFYVSTSANDSNPTVKITIEQKTSGRSTYYLLKDSDGNYCYPSSSGITDISGNRYSDYAVTVTENNDGSFYISRSSGRGNSKTTYYLTLNETGLSSTTDATTGLYLYTKSGEAQEATNTVTFKGVSVGTTYVTIGGIRYTINVTEEELSDVTPLEIEYWITNARITGKTSQKDSLTISAADAYGEEGLTVAGSVDPNGEKDSRQQVYWKSVILDTEEKNTSTSGTELQTTTYGDDETLNGTVFTKVRYWGSKWQVYTTEWIDVDRTQVSFTYTGDNNTTPTYSGDKNQLVAYYMEVINIDNANGENEMTVNAADWGTKGDGTGNWGYTPESSRCSVSVQVVYEDNSTNPANTTADALKSKTIMYGYWSDGRGLGTMVFTGANNYEIYKITAETGTMTSTTGSNNTVTVTGFTWKNNEEVVWGGDEQEPAASASIGNPTRSPSYEEPYDNLAWNTSSYNKNNAILIRVYVKPKASEDSLTVHYVNKATGREFYSYNISVNQGTVFDENFRRVDDKTLAGNTVVNKSGVTQTVKADLSDMAAIGAEYRYSSYKCVEATRADGGKEVYLYYTFDYTVSFVVDFGTPMKISLTDLSDNFKDNESMVNNITVSNQKNGKADVDLTNKTITYTPNAKFVKNPDGELLNITVYGYNPETKQEGNITYTVNIYPASNVLYEEDFLTTTDTLWSNEDAKSHTDAQETQRANVSKNAFGYDETYNESVGANGVWKAEGLTLENYTKEALTTTFYGNTFDLIGNCAPDTGRVLMVFKDANDKYAAIVNVDTRYTVGTISQVPLAHVKLKDGSDAQYTVSIYASGLEADVAENTAVATVAMDTVNAAAYEDEFLNYVLSENDLTLEDVDYISTSAMDNVAASAVDTYSAPKNADAVTTAAHKAGTHVEIDGFRVYRSTEGETAKSYPTDEQDVVYDNILDVVGSYVTAYIDNGTVKNCDVTAYEGKGGPQNEIYLEQNQSVVIQVSDATPIQVSLRAVSGETSWSTNGGVQSIKSNTEMYYTITPAANGTVTIMNSGEKLLALGNVKVKKETTILSAENMDLEAVLESVRAAYDSSAEEPEVFTPETFTAKTTSTTVIRNKVVTLKVNVSSDVAYITVNGVKYTRTGLQGLFQKTRTIRVVNTVPKNQTKTYEIVAYNADGVASETIVVTG